MAIFTATATFIVANTGLTASFALFGTTVSTAGLIASGLRIVAGALISSAVASRQSQQQLQPQEIQANLNQSTGPRRIGYGLNRLGGVRAFWEADDGTLHQVIVHHEGPVSELITYVYDGEVVAHDPATGVISGASVDLEEKVLAIFNNGGTTQNADLVAAFPSMWTADHKLENSVTTYARYIKPKPSKFNTIFAKADKTPLQIDAKCKEVLDLRDGVVKYSDNPALCVNDYLTSNDGARIKASRISEDSIKTWADVNDVFVPTTTSTERRYRMAEVYGLNEAPKEVLPRFLAAADAKVYLSAEGQLAFMPGVYSEPDVTIAPEDILEISAESGRNPLTDFNVLKGTHRSPDHGFQDTEVPERRDEAGILERGEQTAQIDASACPSPFQMQRLMISHEARQKPQWRITLRTNLVGLKARFPKGDGIHTINLEHPRFGGVYEVLNHAFDPVAMQCVIEIASIYDAWDVPASELEEPAPPLDSLNQNSQTGAVPSGLLVSQSVVEISGETNGVEIVANVDDPGRGDLQLTAQYRKTGSTDWKPMLVSEGALVATSGVVGEGEYEVRVYWLGEDVDESSYPEETITVVSNPTIPDAPTGFTATANGSDVDLAWTDGVDGYAKTRVFRNTSSSFSGASFLADVAGLAGQPSSYTDAPSAAGTYYYWVVTLNPSAVSSSETGPETATV